MTGWSRSEQGPIDPLPHGAERSPVGGQLRVLIVKIIMLAIALVSGCVQLPRAEPEIHLIPKGYVGWVTIAFGAANGQAAAYEGDAHPYRIPSTGVLITKAAPKRGQQSRLALLF